MLLVYCLHVILDEVLCMENISYSDEQTQFNLILAFHEIV